MTRGKNVEEWADEIVGCIFDNKLNREEAEKYMVEQLANSSSTIDFDEVRKLLELAEIQLRYSPNQKNARALEMLARALAVMSKNWGLPDIERRAKEAEARLAELTSPLAPLDASMLKKEGGGPWLGAARKWVQWNRMGGDTVRWGSESPLQPPITMRELEDIAAEVAAASMGGTRTTEDVRRATFARWAAEDKVTALRAAWNTTLEKHVQGCTKHIDDVPWCTCGLTQRQTKAYRLLEGRSE